MRATVGLWSVAVALAGCCYTGAVEESQLGTSGASTSGTTGGGTTTGGLRGCGGSATLTGPLAFTIQRVLFCLGPGLGVDAGPDLSAVFIALESSAADAGFDNLGGTCPNTAPGSVIELGYGNARFPGTPLGPGTYALPSDAGFYLSLPSGSAATGTLTIASLSAAAVSGSFDLSVEAPSGPESLSGTFEGGNCGSVGIPP